MVSHQEEAQPMLGGLPGVQRQHQPTVWKLWSLCLLPIGVCLLQWDMHGPEFGREQLRRLRIRLRSGTRMRERVLRRVQLPLHRL
jgi:hypothetical protein